MSVRSSQNFVWARTIEAAFIAALGARPAGALLTTPTVVLITDNNPVIPTDAISNHTLANFSGYSADTISLSTAVNNGEDGVATVGSVLFTATTATPFVSNNITGYLLTDGVTAFYGGEQFTSSVAIGSAGDYLDLTLIAALMFQNPVV